MSSQSELLNEHKALYESLCKVPFERKMRYTQMSYNSYKIGKPRFQTPKFALKIGLINRVLAHFLQVEQYFQMKNYNPRGEINSILDPVQTRINKSSPIFLLENDTWATDAVYGDYHIERIDDFTKIFHFRRNQKINQVEFNGGNVEDVIKDDARNQILNEFTRLWKFIKEELQIAEHLYSLSFEGISEEDVRGQFKMHSNLGNTHPTAAGLILGRLLEISCKLLIRKHGSKLKMKTTEHLVKQIEWLKTKNFIKNDVYELFTKIRKQNNKLKHEIYKPNRTEIRTLWESFGRFLETNKE